PRLQDRHLLPDGGARRRHAPARPRGRRGPMVSNRRRPVGGRLPDRAGHPRPGGRSPEGPGARRGRLIRCAVLLAAAALAAPARPGAAQGVYAYNRVPDGGVRIEYRLEVDDPASHLYRVEIAIDGLG